MTGPEIRASMRALVERGNVAETPGGAVHRAVWSRDAGVQAPLDSSSSWIVQIPPGVQPEPSLSTPMKTIANARNCG